jgi:hypothetical protein
MVTDDNDNDLSTQDLEYLAYTHLSSSDDLSPPTQLSLHALSGTQASDSFRVLGNIASLPVGILVDGGNTHNFVHKNVQRPWAFLIAQSLHYRLWWVVDKSYFAPRFSRGLYLHSGPYIPSGSLRFGVKRC